MPQPLRTMSALQPKADMGTQSRNVRYVPKADIVGASEQPTLDVRLDASSRHRSTHLVLQHATNTYIGREWYARHEGAGVSQIQIRNFRSVEERAVDVIVAVEQILYQAEQFDVLRHLVGRVQVHHPVSRNFWILVRRIAYEVLTADDIEISPELPWIGDLIFRPDLETKVRNGRDVVAGSDEDLVIGIGERVER